VEIQENIVLANPEQIILDMNGKTIKRIVKDADNANDANIIPCIFRISYRKNNVTASFKVIGEGALTSADERVTTTSGWAETQGRIWSFVLYDGTLEIAGDIRDECGLWGCRGGYKNTLLIRDGVFEKDCILECRKTVIYGGDFKGDILYYYDMDRDDEYFAPSKTYIKGGTFNNIGMLGSLYIQGGIVNGVIYSDYNVAISGGSINGKVTAGRGFSMTGGTINATSKIAVDVSGDCDYEHACIPTVRMTGGKIVMGAKNGIGIRAHFAKVVLTGGRIVNTSGNGKCGIVVNNNSVNEIKKTISSWLRKANANDAEDYQKLLDKLDTAKVYWKGEKGKSLQVTGFGCGFAKSSTTTATILKNTRILAPSAKKAKYVSKDKVPDSIKGNLKVTKQ
jgi:hypothetical protein